MRATTGSPCGLEAPLPPFPKPRTRFNPDLAVERRRLHAHRRFRGIPVKGGKSLLIGSWNLANLGLQLQREVDLQLIATIANGSTCWRCRSPAAASRGGDSRENFDDLYQILHYMGSRYRTVMSDPGGNGERMVFVWDDQRVELLDEIGEVTDPPSVLKHVRLEGVEQEFDGF